MTDLKSRKLTGIACAAIALLCLGGIWHRPLFSPEEVRWALISREMLLSGNWGRATLNGLSDFAFPAPAYWAGAAALKVLGESAFALRFFSAVFTLLTAGSIYLFCAGTGEKRRGIVSALLYLCTGLVFVSSGWGAPLPVFAFLTVSAVMTGFYYYSAESAKKRWGCLVAGGLLAGAGFLLNGPVIPLSAGIIFLLYGLAVKAYRSCLAGIIPAGAAAALAALPGAFYLERACPGFWNVYLENSIPVISGINLLFAALGTFPVILLLPAGIAAVRKKGKDFFEQDKQLLFSLLSTLVLGILFVLAGNSSIALALPVFPFLAVCLAGCLLEAEKEGSLSAAEKALHIFCIALGSLVVLFLIWHLLPAVPGKWKFYSQAQAIPPAMIAGLLLLWFNMAAKEKNCFPGRKFLYFCIGCGVLSVSLSHIIPFKFQRQYDRTAFVRRAVLPRLRTGARIFADANMAPAAAWVLHRNVELCFDAGKQGSPSVTLEKLRKIIISANKKGQQIIIFTLRREFLSELPSRRTIIRSGKMAVVIYGDLK